jgi:hypothetical protein
MKPRNKKLLKSELERQGKWKEFVALREDLVKRGVDRPAAWDVAARKMDYSQFADARVQAAVEELKLAPTPKADEPMNERRRTAAPKGPVSFMPGVDVDVRQFKGKSSTPVADLKWVTENMFTKDATAKDAPSATAWGLLMVCRSNPERNEFFWRNIYPKLLPSKAQFETEEQRRGDNGASIIALCERYLAAMKGNNGA